MAVVITATSLDASPSDRLVVRIELGTSDWPMLQVVSVRGSPPEPRLFLSLPPQDRLHTILLRGVYFDPADVGRFEPDKDGEPPPSGDLPRAETPLSGRLSFFTTGSDYYRAAFSPEDEPLCAWFLR